MGWGSLRCQIDTAFLAIRRLEHEFDAAADGAHVANDGGEEHIVGAFDFRDGVLRHTGPGCDILLGGLHGFADLGQCLAQPSLVALGVEACAEFVRQFGAQCFPVSVH